MNRVVPVGDGTYVEVDAQGNPIGAPFDPLTMFSGLSSAAPSTGTVIGPDGKAVQTPRLAAQPEMPPGTATPADDIALAYGQTGPAPQAAPPPQRSLPATNQGAYQAPAASADPVFGAPPANFGGGGDPFANIPNYLNGQRHPAAGGAPLVPGGQFAAQDDGYDNRQQVYVPGGAAAGPFETRAAQAPRQNAYGGNAVQGPGGGDGGGSTSPLYDKLRGKGLAMAGKLKGYGDSGSSSDGYTDPTKQYRRQGRRMDRAYDRYNDELADPDPMRVTGWAKEQGFKPGSVDALLATPEAILPMVRPGFTSNETTAAWSDLPMTDLAMITAGTQGRGLMSKTPVVKPPHILRKNGVDPIKPDYKRSLDSSKVVNRIAEMYTTIGQDPNHRFDSNELLGQLANADKHSAVRQGIEQQARINPANAFDSMRSYIMSAKSAAINDGTSERYDYLQQLDRDLRMDAARFASYKPKQTDNALAEMATKYIV
jgi:hypothetical protein